jgi:type I restriction enzyme R subunit
MSQFIFLQAEFAPLFAHAKQAEMLALSDPRAACFYARLAVETAVKWLYVSDKSLREPYEKTLSALLYEPTFKQLVGYPLFTKTKIIKDLGNRAVHELRPVKQQAAVDALRELFHFCYWLVRTYAKGAKPEAGIQFDPTALPQIQTVEVATLAKLKALEQQLQQEEKARREQEKQRLQDEAEREKLEAENRQMKAEIAAIKKANERLPDTHDYNETQTRDIFIDLLLQEAGWSLDHPRDREFPVTGMPNNTGEGFVDYVLWGNDGKPLALVEAKRTRRDAREGQQQAKLYADCLEKAYGIRPVIFYTNGYQHWLWDDAMYPPRMVQGFLKKDELALLHQRRETRKPLATVSIDTDIAGRYYQTRAIRRVGETFEKDHLRKALLVMATGSGKTRTVIALADQLMRANWAKRVLFLADRVALVKQATNAFKKHLPHASPVNLLTDKDKEGRVFVSTYPTMISLIDEMQNGVRRFGSGHFDLIIIDEAHRSVYQKYRAIFEYFDAHLVGLTATPKHEIDRDTYSLFELQKGVPTDEYDLDVAVSDGFLVPFQPMSVPLKFPQEGIKYDDLSDDEKAEWDALEWDEEGNVPEKVDAPSINKWLFNTDTVDKVLEHLMLNGHKVESGNRLGKTIIFAKNHKHAVFIQERFDAHYPYYKGEFARVIDFKTEYAQSLIDDFSWTDTKIKPRPSKAPHIAISVDMLDTGIDVPEVLNLVFFKTVRSKTKFWQMIGRGTRTCEHLFAPNQHKQDFCIFDFCKNFEFFSQNPDLKESASSPSLNQRLFTSRVELIGEIQQTKTQDNTLQPLYTSIEDRLYDEVAGMKLDNFIVRPKRHYVEKYQDKTVWKSLSDTERHELTEHLAGLPSETTENGELEAKQFDYLMLRLQLALLKAEPAFAKLQLKVQTIASKLETLTNIPMVAAEMALILELQTDEFWQDITLPMLEDVRCRLRKLMKLIEVGSQPIVYTNFEDEIGTATLIEMPLGNNGTDKAKFLAKVRHFLKQHNNHLTIQKVKRNEQLTPVDLSELERIFIEEAGATSTDIEQIRQENGGLGLFIRSLVGLDREAAKKALASFMEGRPFNANQIEFVDMIIDHLTEKGIMEPKALYESPFTDFDDMGISGLFQEDEVKHLINLLNDIRRRVAA